MEDAILKLLTGNPEPWQVVVGVIVLLLAILPRLAALRDSWVGYRENLGQIKRQKAAYELLKLQYEIQALRKQHGLEEIVPNLPGEAAADEASEPKPPSPVWQLLVRHPLLGEIGLRLLQGLVGLYMVVFAIGSVTMPFVFFFGGEMLDISDADLDPTVMALGWFFYLALTYLSYKGYRKCKRLVMDLRKEAQAQGRTT